MTLLLTLTTESLSDAVRTLGTTHAELGAIVERYGEPPLWDRPQGFVTLARIILEQQVSLASAESLFMRLDREMGGFTTQSVLTLGNEGLRSLGVTRQKAAYLHGLADQVAGGRLPLDTLDRQPDDDVTRLLVRVPGIGPWSSSIYLLMALRRPDVWPSGDLALHRAIEHLCGEDRMSRNAIDAVALTWRPWRAVAARILWHGYLSGLTRRPAESAGPKETNR